MEESNALLWEADRHDLAQPGVCQLFQYLSQELMISVFCLTYTASFFSPTLFSSSILNDVIHSMAQLSSLVLELIQSLSTADLTPWSKFLPY